MAATTSNEPWYDFNRIDNFGQIDPQGAYYKPDTNVITPPGYPITALLPGIVTSVQRTSWGQSVVTVKLDSPINSLATHTFYEHMHNPTVKVGQHVNAGDQIGNANYTGEGANLGFGLYSGDVYGSGSAWDVLQRDLAPGGAGMLNPVSLIEAVKSGAKNIVNGTLSYTSSANSNGIFPTVDFTSWGIKIGIFVLASIAVIFGFYMLFSKEVNQTVGTGVKTAAKAAVL